MKFVPVLLLFLSSCTSTIVFVEHPVPKFRVNQKEFKSDVVGEYFVTDSVINEGFFEALNELHDPEIVLESDSSIFIMSIKKIVISKHTVVWKEVVTGYMFRSFYEEQDKKRPSEIDTLVFLEDTVKFISKEQVDTLINIQDQDLVRKYKGHYVLNRWHDEGYQPILLNVDQNGLLTLLDIEDNDLVEYYYSFNSEKGDFKADLVNNGEAIKLKNSELKYLVNNNYFTTWYSFRKMTEIDSAD